MSNPGHITRLHVNEIRTLPSHVAILYAIVWTAAVLLAASEMENCTWTKLTTAWNVSTAAAIVALCDGATV
eukprot:COSAG01_NODE_17725_length_1128_cov_12.740525_2_plen_71_part_00